MTDIRKIRGDNAHPGGDYFNIPHDVNLEGLLIVPDKRLRELDNKKVNDLADSIRSLGVLQPVVVGPGTGDKKTLLAGAHRVAAIQQVWDEWRAAGSDPDTEMPSLPVIEVYLNIADGEAVEIAENLFRNDLTAAQRKTFAARYGELILANGQNTVDGQNRKNGQNRKAGEKSWFTEWYESTNTPLKSAQNWWNDFREATGETCTPAKADEAAQAAFLEWLKGAEDRQAEEKKAKESEQGWTPDQQKRREAVEAGLAVVGNMKAGTDTALIKWAKANGHFERIDRKSDWGNPFLLDEDGDRDEVCDSFEVYLARKPSLQKRIVELRGKVLACWCYPARCHGNHLAAKANPVKRKDFEI